MTAPDTLDLPLLQDAQQCDLGFPGQLADFIEEDGAAVRRLEAAERRCSAPVTLLFVPKQLGGNERRRKWRRSSRDERALARRERL